MFKKSVQLFFVSFLLTVFSAPIFAHQTPDQVYEGLERPSDKIFSYKKRDYAGKKPAVFDSVLRISLPGNGVCSGTVVGVKTILTATHCIENTQKIILNEVSYDIEKILSDSRDHTFVVLKNSNFKNIAKLGSYPKTGDNVYYFGNVGGKVLLLRKGYIAARHDWKFYIDAEVYYGDSGSGVFNEDGEVVGVVTTISGGTQSMDTLFKGWVYKFGAFDKYTFTKSMISEVGLQYPCECQLTID